MTDGPFYLGSFKCSRYLVSRFPQSSFQVYGCISTHPFVGTRGSDRSPLKHRLTLNHIFDSPVRRRPRGVSGQRRNRFAGPANVHGQRRCDLPVVRQRSDRRWRLVRANDRGDLQNPNVRDGRFQQIRRHRREEPNPYTVADKDDYAAQFLTYPAFRHLPFPRRCTA